MLIRLFILLFFSLSLEAKERIIALSPSINEIIYALGAGDEVVGNTEYCKYPKETLKVSKVGGYFSPSLEKIITLNPTLVIMQKNNYRLSQKLTKLNIKTDVVEMNTLDNIKNSFFHLGEILKQKERAKKIVGDINQAIDATKDIVKDKKILIVIGQNTSLDRGVFVAGQNLYFDDIIRASGNQNAFWTTRKGQPILNMENIIATNPDIVIILAPLMREKKLNQKDLIDPWLKLPIRASKTNSIYIMDKAYAGIPSDRLVYFLDEFREILGDFKIKVGN